MGWPASVNGSASLRVDFVVHRSGDSGSPRVSGSVRFSSSLNSSGLVTSAFFRPPPGARTRSDGCSAGSLSSSILPRRIVAFDTPVASWTALIPPRPHDFASVASARRRSRSFKRGNRFAKRARIAWNSSSPLIAIRQLFHVTQDVDRNDMRHVGRFTRSDWLFNYCSYGDRRG